MSTDGIGGGSVSRADRPGLPPTPPKYCNPCIFYSGDFNPNNTLANGLFNGMFSGQDGEVWVPFRIKTKMQVQGLFINELFNLTPPKKVPARWAIKKGVSQGNQGEVVCAGTNTATATRTGRKFPFGGVTYVEWTYLIKLPQSAYCTIVKGKDQGKRLEDGTHPPGMGQCPGICSMSIEPLVSSPGKPAPSILGFLSDVEDKPARHHFGLPNVPDNSFFSSTSFQINFQPTFGGNGVCATTQLSITGLGCDMFSVGLIGAGR